MNILKISSCTLIKKETLQPNKIMNKNSIFHDLLKYLCTYAFTVPGIC